MFNLSEFLEEVLRIPQSNIRRRLAPPRNMSKISDKVLIVFCNVPSRDMVRSYAPNLEAWIHNAENVEAGIRIEVPTTSLEHLRHKKNMALHSRQLTGKDSKEYPLQRLSDEPQHEHQTPHGC